MWKEVRERAVQTRVQCHGGGGELRMVPGALTAVDELSHGGWVACGC